MFNKYSLKIALSIIVAGVFVITAFVGYNYQSLNRGTYVILYLLVLFIFFFGVAVSQNITLPLRRLLENADEFSKGDLKRRLDAKSTDEIGQLAKIFNKIAEDFENKSKESEHLKTSAEIKAKTRILILEEVINALDKKIKNRTLEFQKNIEEAMRLKEQLKMKDVRILELENKLAKGATKKG